MPSKKQLLKENAELKAQIERLEALNIKAANGRRNSPKEESSKKPISYDNPNTAMIHIRDSIINSVLCIANISSESKDQVCAAINYMFRYVEKHMKEDNGSYIISDSLMTEIQKNWLVDLKDEKVIGNYTVSFSVTKNKSK